VDFTAAGASLARAPRTSRDRDAARGATNMKGKMPRETKRAIIGLILLSLGVVCGAAVFFYLLYLLRVGLYHHHRHF